MVFAGESVRVLMLHVDREIPVSFVNGGKMIFDLYMDENVEVCVSRGTGKVCFLLLVALNVFFCCV